MKKIFIILLVSLSLVYGFKFSGSKMTTEMKAGDSPSGPSGDALQLETGDYLLLETGDYLLLE